MGQFFRAMLVVVFINAAWFGLTGVLSSFGLDWFVLSVYGGIAVFFTTPIAVGFWAAAQQRAFFPTAVGVVTGSELLLGSVWVSEGTLQTEVPQVTQLVLYTIASLGTGAFSGLGFTLFSVIASLRKKLDSGDSPRPSMGQGH